MSVANIVPIKKHVYTGPGVYGVTYKIFAATDLIVTLIFPSGATRLLVKEDEYTVALIDAGLNGANITVTTSDYSGGTEVLVSEAGDLVLQEDGTLVYEEGQVLEARAASYIVIAREVEFTQETDWVNGSVLNMPLLTRSFDKTIMLLQQMNEVVKSGSITSNWRGTWVTGIPYYSKDIAIGPSGNWYACHITHESGTFVDDLAAGYWVLVLDMVSINTIAADAIAAKESAIAARDIALAAQAAAEAAQDAAEVAIAASKAVTSSDSSVAIVSTPTSVDLSVSSFVSPLIENLVDISSKPIVHVQEQLAYNVNGAAITADLWKPIKINTLLLNEIAGASLVSGGTDDYITLPPGKYRLRAITALYCSSWASHTFGVFINGALVIQGLTTYGVYYMTPAVEGIITLLNTSNLILSLYCGVASTNGYNNNAGSITNAAMNGIYTDILIERLDITVQN